DRAVKGGRVGDVGRAERDVVLGGAAVRPAPERRAALGRRRGDGVLRVDDRRFGQRRRPAGPVVDDLEAGRGGGKRHRDGRGPDLHGGRVGQAAAVTGGQGQLVEGVVAVVLDGERAAGARAGQERVGVADAAGAVLQGDVP